MTRPLKIVLFIASGLVGLLVIIVTSLHYFVDTTAYKTRLETAASGALGMEVKVGGRLGVDLLPLRVTLKDVHIRKRGVDVAFAKAALIDAKGCSKVQQTIGGPFQKPVVDQPSVFESLAGPALELLKKGKELFSGGECDVFYAGSVAAPE